MSTSNSPKKPIWKRWWFITLAVFVVLGIIGSVSDSGSDSGSNNTASGESTAVVTPEASDAAVAPSTPEPPPKPQFTTAQENAIEAAQNYLDFAPFSRKGLIRQLSSSAGDGYKRSDAEFAVGHIEVNYKAQAVKAAQAYLDMTSFSRQGLIEQLSSSAGDGYTKAQATYAADKVFK